MPGTKTLYLPSSVQTSGVALPRQAESEVLRENRQMLEEMEVVSGKLEYYTHELQQIDPYLKVVMAKPNTTIMGLRGGYYHIVRVRPGSPAWIKTLEGPNGEWRDLDSSIFELVKEADLWNDRTQREVRARQRRAEEARQRQRTREGQDRAHEFDDRLYHATHLSIRIPRSIK